MQPEYILIALTAFAASALTLISGFGLGTILLPVFALFFPVDIAVGLTAIVHLLNNLFKLSLLGRHANKKILLQFGIPSIIAAFAGAWLLLKLSDAPAIGSYSIGNKILYIKYINLTIGSLLFLFSLFEILPFFGKIQFSNKYLIAGGLLSGFFGGLSGHQGALRSLFLVKSGLTKEQFIATGVALACLIDITRLSVYSGHIANAARQYSTILVIAVLSAFAGVFLMTKLIKKITIHFIQQTVAVMLMIFSILIAMGIL